MVLFRPNRVSAGHVQYDCLIKKPPVTVCRTARTAGGRGLGKGGRELSIPDCRSLACTALPNNHIPRQNIEGIAILFQVRALQGIYCILPFVPEACLDVPVRFDNLLTLTRYKEILNKALFFSPDPYPVTPISQKTGCSKTSYHQKPGPQGPTEQKNQTQGQNKPQCQEHEPNDPFQHYV